MNAVLCSSILMESFRPVSPKYAALHWTQFILYTPLLSCLRMGSLSCRQNKLFRLYIGSMLVGIRNFSRPGSGLKRMPLGAALETIFSDNISRGKEVVVSNTLRVSFLLTILSICKLIW